MMGTPIPGSAETCVSPFIIREINNSPPRLLTNADGCDDGGRDDGQGHAPRDGHVPLVVRRLLQLVVSVNLQQINNNLSK